MSDVQFHLRSASQLGSPTNTTGSPRPLMMANRTTHTIHSTGVPKHQIYFAQSDGRFKTINDAFKFVKRLEEVARRAGKPFEYNTVIPVMIDNSAHVLAYADEYVAAHSAGNNQSSHGTLLAVGIDQPLNDGAIRAFQWWNAVLEASGRLIPVSQILPHFQMPGARTSCPGPAVMASYPRLITPYSTPTPVPPPSPSIPSYPGGQDMFKPIHPKRNSNTIHYSGPIQAGQVVEFGLDPAVFPANTVAAAMNVTAVGGPPGSFLTVWGSGPVPETSILNFNPGDAVANGFYLGPVSGLKFRLRASGPMNVICDVTGYWTP